MYKKTLLFIYFSLFSFLAVASADSRIDALVNQLKGGTCKYEISGGALVNRGLTSWLVRRNDKDNCIIDAARALGMLGAQAKPAVGALIKALEQYRNLDSGDGILPLRSEVALALGRIGDNPAIKPLTLALTSEDKLKLSSSALVPEGYELANGTAYGAIAEALGMFGPQAKDALPALEKLMADLEKKQSRAYLQAKQAIDRIKGIQPPLAEPARIQ